MDEFSSKTTCVTLHNSQLDDWMSFPVNRSSSRPGIKKLKKKLSWFLMDEFSSKTVSEISQKFANKG